MTSIVGIAGSSRLSVPVLRRLRDCGLDARGLLADGGQSQPSVDDAERFAKGLATLVVLATDIGETEDILFETSALASRATDLERVIICGTLTPRYVRALRHRIPARIAIIDAPVLGSPRQAGEGQLSFLVGGTAEAVAGAQPVLAALSRRVERMG
ncbi:MAG: NAD(P)-dependent oxidoreductase, partial [Rhodobacteraceae bacterium]|nr:NAD(P)-dependent oxidoreductase [Paracoccaceae bacterium]